LEVCLFIWSGFCLPMKWFIFEPPPKKWKITLIPLIII
jgi:hypothetical protein